MTTDKELIHNLNNAILALKLELADLKLEVEQWHRLYKQTPQRFAGNEPVVWQEADA